MEEAKGAFKLLTGNRPLGRPRRRWEDNIRMNFKELGVNMRNWFSTVQDWNYLGALVNAVFTLRVP